MDCSEYLLNASEYMDGRIQADLAVEMDRHRLACPRCRRYQTTLEKGLDLLRVLPTLDVPGDFHPRLDHRLYHVEDGARIARETLGSGATTTAVLAMAVLLAFVAWTPKARVPEVALEMPPVVVTRPPAASFTRRPGRPTFHRGPSLFTAADFRDDLWGDTHRLLFEYSTLSERRRSQVLSQVGVQ